MSESPNLPPLLRLPMELRLSILKYLLPLDTEGHKTITMRLYEGLRHRDLANLHVEKTYPSRHALSRYLMGVRMVNHKLHADTLTLLYSRTFIIRITEDSSPRTYDCRNWFQYAHQYRRNGWRAFLPGLDLARIKALKIQIEPSNCPGTWPGVHRRMDMFCRMLGRSIGDQELKRLVVEITDTKTSGVELGSRWDDGIGAQDPVEATVEDVIGILQSAWRFIGDVKARPSSHRIHNISQVPSPEEAKLFPSFPEEGIA
jgi:hypothetical protein